MRVKLKWEEYIEEMRTREIELIRKYLNGKTFYTGLEIGAGNGFQSQLLTKFIKNLTCTEFNEDRLLQNSNPDIKYMICDAEKIDSYFPQEKFDFVFSAHLMEHLMQPEKAIKGCYKLLKTDGLSIHIIPSSFNAILRILLWYPNVFLSLLEKYLLNKEAAHAAISIGRGNNLKTKRNWQNNKLLKVIFPRPHGVSNSIFSEIRAFSKKRWLSEFENNNFEVIEVVNGPVHSGYGIGFNFLKKIFAFLGFAGEYIYILNKK